MNNAFFQTKNYMIHFLKSVLKVDNNTITTTTTITTFLQKRPHNFHHINNNVLTTTTMMMMKTRTTLSFAISSIILTLSEHFITSYIQPCHAFHLINNNHQHHRHYQNPQAKSLRTFPFPLSVPPWKLRFHNNQGGPNTHRYGNYNTIKHQSLHSSTSLYDKSNDQPNNNGSEDINNNKNKNNNDENQISSQMKKILEDEIEIKLNSSSSPSTSKQQQKPQPRNDTIAINTIGTAFSVDKEVSSEKSRAASEQILVIDPSTIEVVPFSGLAQEGQVLGGAFSSPSYDLGSNNDLDINSFGSESSSSITNTNGQTELVQENSQDILSETKKIKPKPELNFVNMFRGSANYIANHRNTIVVYHIPGDLLEWEGFSDLMDDIALTWLLGMKPVIVVGCRRQIDERLSTGQCSLTSLSPDGKNVECIEDGRLRYDSVRITDFETLRVVKEEAGFVRYEVERQLGRALHLHGTIDHNACTDGNVVSGNFYTAQPYGVIDGVDFKFTGYPRRFEVNKINQVLDSRDVLLLTPLGSSPSGEIFNVNTEHLAASVAGKLKASKVIFFTKSGTAFREKNSKKLVQNFRLSDAKNLLEYNKIILNNYKGFTSIEHEADLRPEVVEAYLKTGWSIAALEKGVKRAHIIAPTNGALLQELYTRDGSGTLISRDIYEGFRNANVNDVAGIYELIQPFVKTGYLVSRPKNVLEKDIDSYYVFTRDNLIVACAQLKMFENGYAEIGCMVVKKEYRSQGRGDAMLSFLERLSLMCGCPNVFVLSTQTMEWFVEHGYTEVEVEKLPPTRKAVYNYERMSKIYMKEISNIRDLDAAELWWNR